LAHYYTSLLHSEAKMQGLFRRGGRWHGAPVSAVLNLRLRDRCQPSSSRLWQSITKAGVIQPSRSVQTQHGPAFIAYLGHRGPLKSTGLLRACQSLIWQTRCICVLGEPWQVCHRALVEWKSLLVHGLDRSQEANLQRGWMEPSGNCNQPRTGERPLGHPEKRIRTCCAGRPVTDLRIQTLK